MPKMRYLDVDVTVRIRVPFNAAKTEEDVINDLWAWENEHHDRIFIERNNYDKFNDGMVIDEKTGETISEYMTLLSMDNEPVAFPDGQAKARAVIVGRGEMDVGEEEK